MNTFHILLPQFLPSVAYFLPFLQSGITVIADHIQYKKRSLLTRSENLKNNLILTIPVHRKGYTQRIYQKEIAYIESWDRKHLTSIYHHYHMLPYFDEYFHKLEHVYNKQHTYLNYFLVDLLNLFKTLLRIDSDILLSSQEEFSGTLENNLIRFSKKNLNAVFLYNKRDVESGFLNLDKFDKAQVTIRTLPENTNPVFKRTNILEYLFLYGPEAAFKIRQE